MLEPRQPARHPHLHGEEVGDGGPAGGRDRGLVCPAVPFYYAVFFDLGAAAFQTVFILALSLPVPDFSAAVLVAAACVLFDVGSFPLVDLADARFFVALVRDAGFLRAATARVVVAFLVRVFVRRRVRRRSSLPSEAAPMSRSMPKTDDMSSVFKRRRRPLFLVVGTSVTAAATSSAGSTPRNVNSISGS